MSIVRGALLVLFPIAMLGGCSPIDMPDDPDPPPPPGTSNLPLELLFLYRQELHDAADFRVFASRLHEITASDVWFNNCNIDIFPMDGNVGVQLAPMGADGSGGEIAMGESFFAGTYPNIHPGNWNTLLLLREPPDAFGRGSNSFTTRAIVYPGGGMAIGLTPQTDTVTQNFSVVISSEDSGGRSRALAHEIGHQLNLDHNLAATNTYVMYDMADLTGNEITETECLLAQAAGRQWNFFN
jgi:hypothetical protein